MTAVGGVGRGTVADFRTEQVAAPHLRPANMSASSSPPKRRGRGKKAHNLTTAYCLFPTHHHLLNTHVNHVANIRSSESGSAHSGTNNDPHGRSFMFGTT